MLHRPHAATSVLVATLFTGCQAPPRPLVLLDTFPVTYEGHIAPAQPLPAGLTPSCGETAAEELAPSCSSDAALTVRATFVELPVDEVRALLPEWPPQGPRIQGAHLAKDELARHIADWRTRGAIASQPLLVVGFGQDATVRHTKRTAFVSRLYLKGRAGRIPRAAVVREAPRPPGIPRPKCARMTSGRISRGPPTCMCTAPRSRRRWRGCT